jgi:ATP-dependent RNA helicase RhlE
MSFESLGLCPPLLRALADAGYTTPTPIQNEAIPLALAGHDLIAGAQTGTGKTAAFGLPLLQRLSATTPNSKGPRQPRALILAPTRELALQVHDSLRAYARHLSLRLTAVYGGVGMQGQIEALRRGVDILVATPGRLIDHLDRRGVNLSGVEVLVLDEADRMLDMGFLPAIKRILGGLPTQRQTLLFSATFETALKQLAQQFLREPREVQVTPVNTVAETIAHRAHPVDAVRKRDLLLALLRQPGIGQTLVFSRTKHGADKLARLLTQSGIAADAIHGNRNQNQRLRALGGFKQGRIAVLVATDVAARGIDIDRLPTVINFDLPMVAEDYVHRIGRTGRAGAEGQALSLVTVEDLPLLRAINRVLGRELELVEVEGFAPLVPMRVDAPASASRARPASHNRRSHAGGPRRGHAGARGRGAQGGQSAPRQPSRP